MGHDGIHDVLTPNQSLTAWEHKTHRPQETPLCSPEGNEWQKSETFGIVFYNFYGYAIYASFQHFIFVPTFVSVIITNNKQANELVKRRPKLAW